jgi:histidine triad (HIT) family protein
MNDCVFCKIVNGELPSKKVYEDELTYAFHDIHPIAPVHILVVPKKHIVNLDDAKKSNTETLGNCQLTAAKVARIAKVSNAYRVLTANGKKAGQSVFHLHYHVIGGWKKNPPPMEVQG